MNLTKEPESTLNKIELYTIGYLGSAIVGLIIFTIGAYGEIPFEPLSHAFFVTAIAGLSVTFMAIGALVLRVLSLITPSLKEYESRIRVVLALSVYFSGFPALNLAAVSILLTPSETEPLAAARIAASQFYIFFFIVSFFGMIGVYGALVRADAGSFDGADTDG